MTALTIRVPDGKIHDFLAAEADKRSCRPEQLALALMSCTADSGLVDAILDGIEPADIVLPSAKSLQVRVLRAMPTFKAPNGNVVCSYLDIATYLGLGTRGPVHAAIKGLEHKGMIETLVAGKPGVTSRYTVTARGEAFIRALAR